MVLVLVIHVEAALSIRVRRVLRTKGNFLLIVASTLEKILVNSRASNLFTFTTLVCPDTQHLKLITVASETNLRDKFVLFPRLISVVSEAKKER